MGTWKELKYLEIWKEKSWLQQPPNINNICHPPTSSSKPFPILGQEPPTPSISLQQRLQTLPNIYFMFHKHMQILLHMYKHRDTPPEWNPTPSIKVSVLKLTAPKPRSLTGMGMGWMGKGRFGIILSQRLLSDWRVQSFVSSVCRFLRLFYFYLPTGSRFAPLSGSSNVFFVEFLSI